MCVCVCARACTKQAPCFVYTTVYSILGTSADKVPSICVSAVKGQYMIGI